jgi:hypothetical protein
MRFAFMTNTDLKAAPIPARVYRPWNGFALQRQTRFDSKKDTFVRTQIKIKPLSLSHGIAGHPESFARLQLSSPGRPKKPLF